MVKWKERSFHDDKVQKHWRHIVWDEENRVRSVLDGHMEIGERSSDEEKRKYYEYKDEHIQQYIYDDSGERVIKYGHGDEIMVYVNSYYTVRNHEAASKHIFAGNIRMASRLVEYDTEKEMDDAHEGHRSRSSSKPDHKHEAVFFYHGDHLGSNHYVSDERGRLQEHLEYFPFGELWVEEGNDTVNPLYRFTAKEFDDETKLYYFGARYYDPRTSVWISPDPAERFTSASPTIGLNLYQYTLWNPLRLVDPDGRLEAENKDGVINYTVTKGDWLSKIASQTANTVDAIMGANPQIEDPDKIAPGDKINIPTNSNMKRFEAAVKQIGKTDWARAASKDGFLPNSPKCNLFVANMNEEIGASTPNNIDNGKPSPWLATANTWGDSSDILLGSYLSIPERAAAAGDIVSFRNLTKNQKTGNMNSGHVGIYTGGISIKSNGYSYSGNRFIAAGTSKVNAPTIRSWKNKSSYAAPVYRMGD